MVPLPNGKDLHAVGRVRSKVKGRSSAALFVIAPGSSSYASFFAATSEPHGPISFSIRAPARTRCCDLSAMPRRILCVLAGLIEDVLILGGGANGGLIVFICWMGLAAIPWLIGYAFATF
jgi:hypothetical protein